MSDSKPLSDTSPSPWSRETFNNLAPSSFKKNEKAKQDERNTTELAPPGNSSQPESLNKLENAKKTYKPMLKVARLSLSSLAS
jgi:hypothetical protein